MTDSHKTTSDLVAAAKQARAVLRNVAALRRKIGPLATAAQQAAWQISAALGDGEEHHDKPT